MNIKRLIGAQPAAAHTERLYGKGYYHGENSGYPREGYGHRHPDWEPWCDLLASLIPSGGLLLDLGCAYGFLVEEARKRGFQAFGFDISSYALTRGHAAGRLGRCTLERLPLPDQCADAVCLFDVLEHLYDPLAALREARRVLQPRGLLIGATPDAPFFSRQEETHCFERPASFWTAALEELGLEYRFRFSEEDYNFQFLAGEEGLSRLLGRFQHDYFDDSPDVVQSGPPLRAVLRPGWARLRGGARRPLKWPARIYLLNPLRVPLRVRGQLHLRAQGWARMRIRWNSQVLADLRPRPEPLQGVFQLPEFLLPSGGHHLFLESFPPQTRWEIGPIVLQSQAARSGPLRRGLPFDLYQRYRMAAEAARVLGPRTLLDMGGYMGDADGHLAVSSDFLAPAESGRSPQVISCDRRLCDHPDYLRDDDPLLQNARFDMVVCLDVLEHVPPRQRPAFLDRLQQLARRWIVLAGPFASPQVEAAEGRLREGLMAARRFLEEHARYGLPDLQQVLQRFQEAGWTVIDLPNGYLPHWEEGQALTQHYFALDDYGSSVLLNRILNSSRYSGDNRQPCYRRLLVISREPLGEETGAAVQDLSSQAGKPEVPPLSRHPGFLQLQERVINLLAERGPAADDLCFLLNEREKHIELLQASLRELERLNAQPLHKIALRRLKERG
ncbi:MAG TPA: class I SAM-dependent methyltransferase [Acidobacteriota bacterium]|nr:class I SAM-dependent methyltransferase [Acidobacteriota bacterium]